MLIFDKTCAFATKIRPKMRGERLKAAPLKTKMALYVGFPFQRVKKYMWAGFSTVE